MLLLEALQFQGRPFLVKDCNRDELPQFFKDMGYKTGAEVGVFVGKYTELFCRAGMKMFAIDPWYAFTGQGRCYRHQEDQDRRYKEAVKRLSPYRCTVIRKTSMDALPDIKDGELDFVYLDGDHSFRYIAEDISEWTMKVRKGGIVAGHDYWCSLPHATGLLCHVRPVVDIYCQIYNRDFYVLDEPGSSWFFVV